MRKVLFILTAVAMITGCAKTNDKMVNEQMSKCENEKMKLSFMTEQAAAMTAIACNEAKGDLIALESAIESGLDAGLTVNQIKEALSQLYAYTGFPRSLNALERAADSYGGLTDRDFLRLR